MNADAAFFDYACPLCGAPFCERVQLMNFAVGVIDDPTCLSCLGKEFQRSEAAMAAYCWRYIQQRECFLTPWQAFDPSPCPRREGLNADCPCDREATPGNETPLP